MQCHEVDYEIIGDDIQLVEVELDAGETVIAEAGAMNYMEDGIGFETKMGDGSVPDEGLMGKLFSAGKRMMTGESLFMTHFKNNGTVRSGSHLRHPTRGRSCRSTWPNLAASCSVKKTHSCARPWARKSVLPSPSG